MTDGYWNRTWGFSKIGARKIAANKAEYCRFTLGQVSQMVTNRKPTADSATGSYTACSNFKKIGRKRYRMYAFGFWYPRTVSWAWERSSCRTGITTRAQTTIGPGQAKANRGKFNSPGASGGLGKTEFQTYNGANTQNPAGQGYFGDVQLCELQRDGWSRKGEWLVDPDSGFGKSPQPGWGTYNAGARMFNGQYIANFNFHWTDDRAAGVAIRPTAADTNLSPTDGPIASGVNGCPVLWKSNIKPGVCWSLSADYDGYLNRIWVSHNRKVADANVESQYVKVYGPKASR